MASNHKQQQKPTPRHERPIVTVDVVPLTLTDGALQVALYPRAREPHRGAAALPGGYVHTDADRDLDAAARRVLREKTVLRGVHLEQLATFSGRKRDPRGWSLSAAYVALIPAERLLASDAPAPQLTPVDPLPRRLPFDHSAILATAVARVRSKSVYSTLPTFLMPDQFTIAELRDTYQLVLALDRLDLAGFRKKILDLGVIEPIEGAMRTGSHRPAQLYRRADRQITLFDRTI